MGRFASLPDCFNGPSLDGFAFTNRRDIEIRAGWTRIRDRLTTTTTTKITASITGG